MVEKYGSNPFDPGKLAFIDGEPSRRHRFEPRWRTGPATNMARAHGRCRRGERLRTGFPHRHRKTTTLIAGSRLDGMAAPLALVLGPIADNGSLPDGSINGDWLEAYAAQ
jgi:hypothetical protein